MKTSKKTLSPKVAPAQPTDRRVYIAIILLLVIGTVAVFARVAHSGFIMLDDPDYVSANPFIRGGLTAENIAWAFTNHGHSANWHPLTWISHMADVQFFGLNKPGLHHLTSLLLHILGTVFLFLVLSKMTGAVWKAAFVAALFAVHPAHVESVAWVAERKDVLSTLFWALTMYAYAFYVERPSTGKYTLVVTALVLGLLSKPMLVTLPLVLLMLDYWPLGRSGKGWKALIVEKLPLFALVLASCVVTFVVQRGTGAVGSMESLPVQYRVGNAFLAYVSYIGKLIWPSPLAVFYPHPGARLFEGDMLLRLAGSVVVLACITAFVIKRARKNPYLATGWLWFIVTLIPVIGLVQVGSQGSADRYTYVPFVGLFVVLAWGIPELVSRWATPKMLAAAAVALIAVYLPVTYAQVGHWKNSVSIFEHSVRVVPRSHLAWADLGVEYEVQYGAKKDPALLDRAIECYQTSLDINSTQPITQSNIAHAFISHGDLDLAIEHLYAALKLREPFAVAHFNLGTAYGAKKLYLEALEQYKLSAEQYPKRLKTAALRGVADMAGKVGRHDDAIDALRQVTEISPDNAEAQNQLGMALGELGRNEDAIAAFQEAIRLDPKFCVAHYNVGYAMNQLGRFAEAIPYFERALELDPNFQAALYQIAVAELKTGDYRHAWEHIHAVEALGIQPEPTIISTLRSKMPEPTR